MLRRFVLVAPSARFRRMSEQARRAKDVRREKVMNGKVATFRSTSRVLLNYKNSDQGGSSAIVQETQTSTIPPTPLLENQEIQRVSFRDNEHIIEVIGDSSVGHIDACPDTDFMSTGTSVDLLPYNTTSKDAANCKEIILPDLDNGHGRKVRHLFSREVRPSSIYQRRSTQHRHQLVKGPLPFLWNLAS